MGSASAPGFVTGGNGISDKISQSLKEIFRPEFLNRVDEVIEFTNLSKEELKAICDLMLKDMIGELRGMGIGFEITDDAREALVDKGYTPRYGARPIRREIQTLIEDPISSLLLSEEVKRGNTIKVSKNGEEIEVGVE